MLDAGFYNKEHSVYETAFLCSNYKVACTLNTLLTKHPYLNKAIKDIRVYDIDDRVHVFVNSKIKITKKVGIIITSFGNEKLS